MVQANFMVEVIKDSVNDTGTFLKNQFDVGSSCFPQQLGSHKSFDKYKKQTGHIKVSTNINKDWSHKSVDKYCLQQLDGASCCLLPPRQSQK